MEPFPSPREEPRRGFAVHDLLNHSPPPANHLNSHPHYRHHPQPQPAPPPYALQHQGHQSSQLPRVLSPHQSGSPALADNHTESRYPPWQVTNVVPNPRPSIQGPGFPPASIGASIPGNHFAPSRRPDLAVSQPRHTPAEPLPNRRDIFALPVPQLQHAMTNPHTPGSMPDSRAKKGCIICLELFFDDDAQNAFPWKCLRCSSGQVCAKCLKEWFLDACRNESKMPPKCCKIIPLSAVSGLLKVAEIDLYKSKFEEWSTSDRFYCPVPTCSAFIPPRLYLCDSTDAPENHLGASASHRGQVDDAVAAYEETLDIPETSFDRPKILTQGPAEYEHRQWPPSPFLQPGNRSLKRMKPHVICPTCATSICSKCRSATHLGECSENDIDPELDKLLKKWKIKRCPKCRAGVRKVFGCSHIECRCGAHFCFECLKSINVCDGGCEEDDSDEYDQANYQIEEDDLDGRAGFHEGDGHEFGNEPYGTIIEYWACDHKFMRSSLPGVVSANKRAPMECHRCFRHVKVYETSETVLAAKGEDIPMVGYSTQPGWPTNVFGEPAWQCVTGHLRCERCPKFAVSSTNLAEARYYRCDCGMECEDCAKSIKEIGNETAWECRCGMVLCGECKKNSELS